MSRETAGARSPSPREADDWVERVRAASDIVEVVGQTVALKRVGRNWVGRCPFHEERTPSFSVHAERQFYHCFSCKAGGDVFRFVQETEHIGFREAVELLSRRAGIPVPSRRGSEPSRRPVLDALEAAAVAYEQWLADPREGEAARRYLSERGLQSETIREYRLGFAPDGWEHVTRRLGERFGLDALVEAGLSVRRDTGRDGYDRFRGRLMIPLIAPGGAVVGFGARALQAAQEPKYLNSPESAVYRKRAFLFGYEQARRALGREAELVLVEGYFDAISLHQSGVSHVVATSGTALTPEHARLLRRVVPTVVLTYDGDAAGQDAMLRGLGTLLAAELEVRVVELAPGEDPDLLARRHGIEGWRRARAEAMDPIEYVQKHGLRRPGPGDSRERALQAIVALATEIQDPVRQRLFLERSAQVFGIAERVLARAVGLKRAGHRAAAPIQAAVKIQAESDAFLERQLLQALLQAPQHLEGVRPHLSPEDFQDPACLRLARALWSAEPVRDESVEALERELLADAEADLDWAAIVEGGVRRLARRRWDRQRRDVHQRLLRVQRDRPADADVADELLTEYQKLTELIHELDRAETTPRGGESIPTN